MNKHLGILMISACTALPSHAAETDGLFNYSDLEWFGNLSATYMDSNGEINFYGNTASVYGRTPSISMDDGEGLSLAVGFKTRDGWRLSVELGQISLSSSTNDVFGLDDRIGDTFRVDAEIESLGFDDISSQQWQLGLDFEF